MGKGKRKANGKGKWDRGSNRCSKKENRKGK